MTKKIKDQRSKIKEQRLKIISIYRERAGMARGDVRNA
jgi:hypothetical protein